MVETFVDARRFRGTCDRAANWVEVGLTEGRGRQDRAHRRAQGQKRVFLYPLAPKVRLRLGAAPPACGPVPAPGLGPTPRLGSTAEDWAEGEFGGVSLGDRRLSQRLLTLAREFAARPQASIPQACQSRAKTTAA